MEDCRHCGEPVLTGGDFCCTGCEAAYALVQGMGLDAYYERRALDPSARPLKPDDDLQPRDYALHVRADSNGSHELHLMVDGVQCAACVWLIEAVLRRQSGVTRARVNMTTRRLTIVWQGTPEDAERIVTPVLHLGYRLVPYDPAILSAENDQRTKELLRALAIAGFAAGNVMLLSVSIWAGHSQGMGPATRDLLHWLSALIALPAVAYAGVPFYRSALGALRAGRVNMDVPISLAVLLSAFVSIHQTMNSGTHAYFDSSVTLLFFLLIGRYLDRRARGKARAAAAHLVGLSAMAVTVLEADGTRRVLPPSQVHKSMTVLAAPGERLAVDGTVATGTSDVDTALITGESLPAGVAPGARVYAGTLNLSGMLTVTVGAVGEDTLLAEIVRLMERAEDGRARYVAVADRVARWYAPVVHTLATAAFLGWWGLAGLAWPDALMIAVAVLIITCPCALALAVPVVHVVATSRLMRQGILVKSGTALERLAEVDRAVFDKTGTLTLGRAELTNAPDIDDDAFDVAAALAAASRHPLARAVVRARPGVALANGVVEEPGRGLAWQGVRLGSRIWCGIDDGSAPQGPELWLARPDGTPVVFRFVDAVRIDAKATVADLAQQEIASEALSGDSQSAVQHAATAAGMSVWSAAQSPTDKVARLQALAAQGHCAMMVGDGLNDAPALQAAHVSLSPATAADVSQNAADVVFQGDKLGPVSECIRVARRARVLVRQNFALAFAYNMVTVPLAVAGQVTPLIAAVAMSASSLVVISNALRLGRKKAGN